MPLAFTKRTCSSSAQTHLPNCVIESSACPPSCSGSSPSSSIRQYAEHNHRPVALLAISRFETSNGADFVRVLITDQCVTSPSFVTRYGHLDDLIPCSRLAPSQPLFHVMHDLAPGVGETTEL